MKLSIDVTPKKVLTSLVWITVGFVLLGALWFTLFLLTARGDTGAGYVLMGIMVVAERYFYLLLVPILTVGIGVARDAQNGKSVSFSIFKWFCAGLALYIVTLVVFLGVMLH